MGSGSLLMSSTNAQLASYFHDPDYIFDDLLLDSPPHIHIPEQISADIGNPHPNPDLQDICINFSPFQPQEEDVGAIKMLTQEQVEQCNADQSNSNAKSRGAKKRKNVSAGYCSPRETHKLLERERRKCMHDLFMTLHSLLPHQNIPSKKEQSAILDETIKYIPLAEAKLQELKTTKKSLLAETDNISTGIQSSSSQTGGHVKSVLESREGNNTSYAGSSSSGDDCCCQNNISVKLEENGEVNIILRINSNNWVVPLSRIMEHLEMEGLLVTNCTLFNNGTTFFHYFRAKYSGAGGETRIRRRLQAILNASYRKRKSYESSAVCSMHHQCT